MKVAEDLKGVVRDLESGKFDGVTSMVVVGYGTVGDMVSMVCLQVGEELDTPTTVGVLEMAKAGVLKQGR